MTFGSICIRFALKRNGKMGDDEMEWRFENVVHWTQETAVMNERIKNMKKRNYLIYCAVILLLVDALVDFFISFYQWKILIAVALIMFVKARRYTFTMPRATAVQFCKQWMATGGMPVSQIRVNAENLEYEILQTGGCFTVPLQDIKQIWSTERYLILQFPVQIQILLQKDGFVQGDLEGFASFLREACPKVKWKYLRRE